MAAKHRSSQSASRRAVRPGSFGLERRREPVLPPAQFIQRLGRWAALAATIVTISLVAGMCGYHFLEGLPWIDALLNASMILGGMGLVDPVKTDAGKLFASVYALYSGLAIISVAGLLLAPVVHRFLHKFHVDADAD
jgi:hypothetical protein